MEIHVIRHTAVATGNDICYGQSHVPLADTFAQDVEVLEKKISGHFDAVYCSPAQRCTELANALRLEGINLENALMELNFGDWEQKKWNEIEPSELNRWMADFVHIRTPNGENLLELFERVKTFMDRIRLLKHKRVLLITHAGVIRCLWAYMLDIPLRNIFKIPVGYHEVFVCSLTNSGSTDGIRQLQ
jgi:alpha-ribazole phosphatase